jgi:membrane-bound serine protease (ClpP class)
VEADFPGFGYFGFAGTVSLLLGGLLLFGGFTRPDIQPPSFEPPDIRVNIYLLVGLTAGIFALWMFVIRAMLNARTEGTTGPTTPSSIIGQMGVAASALSPRGSVTIAGEEWSAVTDDRQAAEKGVAVEVVGQDGLVLLVTPTETVDSE